ncbi:MAG: ABC transporter substrate-binding protein [Caldilineaceae bacterium]
MVTKTLSRRAFMHWSVLSTGAVIAAACAPTAAPAQPAQEAAKPTAAQQAAAAPAAGSGQYKEAPMLAELVKAGKLPPVDERLPKTPLVVEPVEQVGTYGGAWRMLDSGDGLGYLCMAAYVEPFLKWKRDVSGHRANLLETWEWNDKATELTTHFRQGLKWSDGQPMTVDDYLFWWNDLVIDESVPVVEPAGTRVGGELMKVDKVDDYTLKFTFAAPNPLFLEYHSRGFYHSSWFMVPAHYFKQLHPKYNKENKDSNKLMDVYNNRHHLPDVPTHTAWKVTEFQSGKRAVFERNPYYWKVDSAGNQLPYIDRIEVQIPQDAAAAAELMTLKGVAGELDMQVRDFAIKDVPVLKENEEKGGYHVTMWNRGDYAWPWIMLFYDYPDKDIVELMYNQKFRQALSYAIDRDRINQVVALGLAKPRQFCLSPESPEFSTPEGKKVYEAWSTSYASHEPDKAKALLDAAGVVDKNGDGFRERPDGKPLELIVDIPTSDQRSIDAMDLVKEDWEKVGLKTTLNVIDGTVVEQRTTAGETMIRAWGSAAAWGLISAPPVWAPIEGVTYCGGGDRIGLYYQTGGKQGVAPRPGSMLEKLQKIYTDLISIVDAKARDAKLLEAYQVHIDEGPITIGTIGEHPSPVLVKNNFHNVQATGLVASWDLGFPGTADPEQFYIQQGA